MEDLKTKLKDFKNIYVATECEWRYIIDNNLIVPYGCIIIFKDDIYVYVGKWKKMCSCEFN